MRVALMFVETAASAYLKDMKFNASTRSEDSDPPKAWLRARCRVCLPAVDVPRLSA